ncbi:MAG: alpha/beta hydrolase [Polyangiaceae bacterium]
MRQLRLVFGAWWATLLRRLRKGPRRPGWGFVFEFVIELLRRDWQELRAWDAPSVRRELSRKPMPKSATKRVRRAELDLDGVRAVDVTPPELRTDVVILYLHGGSYLFGSPETHADVAARHAIAAGARVVVPEYRLAPEHPYPAALDDAARAFAALVRSGVPPERVAIVGESAGGGLTVLLALRLAAAGTPPRAIAALSPWMDLSASKPSTETQDDDYGDRDMLLAHARQFASALPLDDPRVSPLFADLAGLPRTLVQVGTAERLLDEATAFAERAKSAGVDATLDLLPEMPHAPHLLAEWCGEGQRAIERAARFLTSSDSAR